MARSETYTLLPLDQWAEMLGINPWIFNQFDPLPIFGRGTPCQDVWYQYSWQGKFLSRDEIARAVQNAEESIIDMVRFYPAPKYTAGETIVTPPPRDRGPKSPFKLDGTWKTLTTSKLMVSGVGKQTWSELATVNVVRDANNLQTAFTVTFDNSANNYNPDELHVCFTAADRDNAEIDLTWEIRPLKAQVSGTDVIFSGPQYLLAKPSAVNTLAAAKLDPTDANSYITQVTVYRIYLDTTHTASDPNQGLASWNRSYGLWPWPDSCYADCSVVTAPVCYQNYDGDAGIVSAQIDYADWPHCLGFGPDKFHINYVSGMPLKNRQMDSFWAEAVVKLSVARLPAEQCGCDRHNAILRYWRIVPSEGNNNARPLSLEEINAPFGPERGARFAWERIRGYVVDETIL